MLGVLVEYIALQLVCWWLYSVAIFYAHLVFPIKLARVKHAHPHALKITYICIAVLGTIITLILYNTSIFINSPVITSSALYYCAVEPNPQIYSEWISSLILYT